MLTSVPPCRDYGKATACTEVYAPVRPPTTVTCRPLSHVRKFKNRCGKPGLRPRTPHTGRAKPGQDSARMFRRCTPLPVPVPARTLAAADTLPVRANAPTRRLVIEATYDL